MFRYYKFDFPSGGGNSNVIMIAELEFRQGGVDITSPSTVVTADDNYASYVPSKMVDDSSDLEQRWQVNSVLPHWALIDLTSPSSVPEYSIKASSQPGYSPVDWTLSGSNDLSTWQVVDTRSSQTGWGSGEVRVFTTALVKQVSGVIVDSNGSPVARTLRVYRRDTGAFLTTVVSNSVTGQYSASLAYAGEVQVVMLDDALGTLENDQILRTIPV